MVTSKKVALSPRNLKPDQLGGVIFGCTDSTINECLAKQLFGLPGPHFVYVKNINPGMPLFLFNYTKRQLHGIFEAASPGQMNIDPYGWTKDGSKRTLYPAQVQIHVQKNCCPLMENQFAPIIKGNYYSLTHFQFELDHAQVGKLITLLSTQLVAPSATMLRATGKWQIANQHPSEPRAKKEDRIKLPAAYVNPTTCSESDGSLILTGPSSYLDRIHQPIQNDIEAMEKHEVGLIYEKLQRLAETCEPFDSHSTRQVQGLETKMHNEDDYSQGENLGQQESTNESFSLPSDLNSVIAELQELRAFKQESIETMVQLTQIQTKLLSEVKQLQDRCTRLETLSNKSETYASVTMEFNSEQHLDQDGSIFLAGGFDGKSWLASLESYSPPEDIIKSLKPMSSLRSTSLAKLKDDLYVIGGENGGLWFDTVESYDPVNNDWTSLPCLNEKKGGLAASTLHDKIFALGGANGIHCFSDVEMFDVDVGRWIPARSMLQKRFNLAAVEFNGAIYAVGGYDGKEYLSSAERFDLREHSWSRLESMNSKRASHSLVVLNEKLYAIGGFDGGTMVATVEVFDPRRGTWMSEAPMNESRGYFAAAGLNGSIYAIGGIGEEGNTLEKVEQFKEGHGWQLTDLKAIGKRCYHSAIVM